MSKYYYIEENNKIIGFDTDKARLEQIIAMPQYSHLEIKETERPIVNFEFADTDEYKQKQVSEREKNSGQNFLKYQM